MKAANDLADLIANNEVSVLFAEGVGYLSREQRAMIYVALREYAQRESPQNVVYAQLVGPSSKCEGEHT